MNPSTIGATFVTLLLGAGAAAAAPFNCGTSPHITAGNVVLTQNWETNSATTPCITLQGGWDVDLNGFSIICTNPSGCAQAISGSLSGNPGAQILGPGNIVGPFQEAIYAQVDEVRSITVDGASWGIVAHRAKQIHKNVVINTPEIGIFAEFNGAATDFVANNFVSIRLPATGAQGVGIMVMGGPPAGTTPQGSKLEKNYIENYVRGIEFIDTTKIRVLSNALGDRGDVAVSNRVPIFTGTYTANKVFTGNLCTDDQYCPTPTPPFTLP